MRRLADLCGLEGFGVVLVRRREDAKGDGNAGVKVQIDDLEVQRTLLECLSGDERKTRRGLLLLWGKEERGGKKTFAERFLTRLSIEELTDWEREREKCRVVEVVCNVVVLLWRREKEGRRRWKGLLF